MDLHTIDLADLDCVTGGAKEGIFGGIRAGLVGLSLLTNNPAQMPPRVEPVRIEQPAPIQR